MSNTINTVLGIDFGTCYSCVSYFDLENNTIKVIPNENGELTSASALYFDPFSSDILYGNVAKNCKGAFTNLKRLIGKDLNNLGELAPFFTENTIIDGKFEIPFNNKTIQMSTQDLIIIYLSYLKKITTEFSGANPNVTFDIVITTPVYYSDNQREITKDCATKAGFNVIRIINEPTAAALAYSTRKHSEQSEQREPEEENTLVFDCGGGTTDLSFINMDYQENFHQVKNVIGNNLLGGEDITKVLYDHFKQIHPNVKTNTLKKACEQMKRELSYNNNSTVVLGDQCIRMTQHKFIDLAKEPFNKIQKLIKSLLNDIGDKTTIHKVIFIGGTTRIPYITTIFKNLFGNRQVTICADIDPDQTVSIGATTQGALLKNLYGNGSNGSCVDGCILLDIIPLSIGIETLGGIMVPIVSRNTCIPVSRTREFTNTDSDSEILINIYQGERRLVSDNYYLTSFKLIVPEAEPGTLLIKVTFDIDSDSIISASALVTSKNTLIESKITITKETVSKVIENVDLDAILMNAEENKLFDSEIANKILMKIELYESFKKLLGIFHEKRDVILQDRESETESFLFSQLNLLFNETFVIINDYLKYTSKELKETREIFEREWHSLLFDNGPVFKDESGLIIDINQFTTLE